MTRPRNIIVHWGGKMITGACGVDYEGGNSRLLKFRGKVNHNQLIDKISTAMKLEFNKKVCKVVYRFPVSVSTQASANFSQLEIEDDDGVEFMFDSYDGIPGLFCIQMYVDIETIQIDLEQDASFMEHNTRERRQTSPPLQERVPFPPRLNPRDYAEHNTLEHRQNTPPLQERVPVPLRLLSGDYTEYDTRNRRQSTTPVQESVPFTLGPHPRDNLNLEHNTREPRRSSTPVQESVPFTLGPHPRDITEHNTQEPRRITTPVQESVPFTLGRLARDTIENNTQEPRQNTSVQESHPRDITEHNTQEPRRSTTPVQESVPFTLGRLPRDNTENNTQEPRQNTSVQESVPVTPRMHPEDYMQPGPLDTSVLTLQRVHRSEAVWHDKVEKSVLHCRRAGSVAHTREIDSRIVPYLEQAGFYGVARLGFIQLDWQLISALVERWRPETHTFHLPEGECTITLQDVGIIAGLPVDGQVVSGCASHDWGDVCLRLLGVTPPEDSVRGSVLQLSWLAEAFQELPADANDFTVQCYARAFLLRLIGGIIFSNKSSSRVHLMFLPLFEDFQKAAQYSWGAACLAWLYRELCRATNPTAKEISGPLFLLQLWALERLPHITSISRENLPQQPLSPPAPLGCRWRYAKIVNEVSTQVLQQYRYALDRQGPDQMIWQPYADDVIARLPPCCTSGRAIWRAVVPLICFHIVEWHQPDRVMRQFGLQQPIPVKPHQDDALHTIDLRGNQELSWLTQHASYNSLWDDRHSRVIHGEPTQDRLQYNSEYMTWYRKITRRWISPMGAAIGAVVDGIEQIYLNSGVNASLDRMADIHQTAARILGALDEERRIISVNSNSTQRAPEAVQLPGLEQGDKPTTRRRRPTLAHRRLPIEVDQSQLYTPATKPLLFRVAPSVASVSNAARGQKRGRTGNKLGPDGVPSQVTADAPILLE
ncbi:serine/threonine-protein phosphatase 7 long form homolog [Euphorbia lathyris]|uniref:serine/threonine-protein phosphatase 7 long form homolog n=1 Tax=Euphorbia lathyris TaxID=212925 RepID=UPI003313A5D5